VYSTVRNTFLILQLGFTGLTCGRTLGVTSRCRVGSQLHLFDGPSVPFSVVVDVHGKKVELLARAYEACINAQPVVSQNLHSRRLPRH
jgi:hypothetical protein